MATKTEKLIYSIVTAVILFLAIGLDLGGAFVPFWTRPINETDPDTKGNVSFSLWTKRECWDVICRTKLLLVKWTTEECTQVDGRDSCVTTTGYKQKPKTECFDVFYCNITWQVNEDPDKIPSLLFVAKAFETPAVAAGVIALILYIIKIIMLLKCTDTKRLHIKAAYLTFCAIAGAAAEIGVIIFCVMLEKDIYHLGWGPALPGVGGFLQLCIALGGYLSWRNGPGDDFFDEDDEAFLEKAPPLKRPTRPAPPLPPKPEAVVLRSVSVTSNRSANV
ncbi:hypothetical protein SNE40_000245 [Patella caerulea]|uniref:Uncharacterized protein n=1 Tax=Patella caerulea TaxID=87958 RepID=A0AAN8KG73_PATCE